MPKFEGSASYGAPAGAVFNAAAQAVQNLPGWKLKEVNQNGWYLMAAVSFSLWSYGEDIAIQVSEPAPGQPVITASSSSVSALFDFGKNRRKANKLFAEVQNVLVQSGYVQAPATVNCPGCGVQLRPGARFCTNCGRQTPG